jgi:hypothetical protein
MRAGDSPYKENAAWKLFQNQGLMKDGRPADGDKIVCEAAVLVHKEATQELHRRGLRVPAWAALSGGAGSGGSPNS